MTKEIHDINTKALDRPQEWIPCGERMPEYRKTVLISTFWGVKTGFLDSTEAYGDFWEIIEDDATAALHSIYAWMPLPKPYKADRKTEPQTDCTTCDQVGRCERGRAVECPQTERSE